MKTNRLLLIIGVGTALAAAATLIALLVFNAKETLPSNSFRLTATTVYNRSDEQIHLLTIETREPQWQQVWSPGQTWGGYTSNRRPDDDSLAFEAIVKDQDACVGQIWIIVSRISRGGKDQVKIIIGNGATVRETSPGTPLNRIFSLQMKDGVYQLGEPLIIGQMNGDAVKLGVGPHSKVETLRVEDRAVRGDPER